jgi:hypothetical protein
VEEVAADVAFMGYPSPGLGAGCGGTGRRRHGRIAWFLRDGDRVFLTSATTGRGNQPVHGSLGCST